MKFQQTRCGPTSWRADVAAALWRLNCSWQHIAFVLGGVTRQRVFQLLTSAGIDVRTEQAMRRAYLVPAAVQAAIREGHITHKAIRAYLRAAGIRRVTEERITEGLRAHGYVYGMPPAPGPDYLHCPRCGWLPQTAFHPKYQRERMSGRMCRACNTATARDWRSPGDPLHPRLNAARGEPLTETLGCRLSPEFAEWMMGFPVGWTDVSE